MASEAIRSTRGDAPSSRTSLPHLPRFKVPAANASLAHDRKHRFAQESSKNTREKPISLVIRGLSRKDFVPRLCLRWQRPPAMRPKMNVEAEFMQNGSIMRSERRRGPDVWEYRWREPGADGKRKHRRMVIGSVAQFRDKDSAVRAISALRRDINMANVRSKGKPLTLSQLADHYSQRELSPSCRWKTHSTKLGYRGYLRKWIIPRWGATR